MWKMEKAATTGTLANLFSRFVIKASMYFPRKVSAQLYVGSSMATSCEIGDNRPVM